MGPKKKGKGSKLARMSEEERIRYMQHRAAIEEEARRRKEQLIATYMKNKLKHEEAFMRLNSAKINQQWRQILRKVKCKELKDNMKILWTTFEEAVISKNKIIETLLSDLEESEIQYSMMLENHVQIVNRLIGLHQDRLNTLHKHYSHEKAALLDSACKERATTTTDNEFACEFLQTVIFDMNSRNSLQHRASTSAAAAKQDELRNQMQSEIEKTEEQGGLQIEAVWRDIQQVLKDYITDTAPNRPHYNALRAKDKSNTDQLIRHCETVNKYSDFIVDLKQQLVSMQCSQSVKLRELKEEQSDFLAQFDRLRQTVNSNQVKDQAKLTTMAVSSSDVIREEGDVPLKVMDNFWQRYNEVILECEQLHMEKDTYSTENKQLRRILRHYLNTLVRPTSVPRAKA
ncbi:dynein regulatory complex subunit 2 isoform X2 [Macrosteles quadrilineatus]|uniref:dynein regulatory complex subunit 2 isoform X2 n=1 Tax=Macrosteles quadrilineatus TaxID=74068 RepID=UPI0023E18FC1|nr:dynein regulatory complex subunit 2 isoform X2 [Macrosteles quadrilineatus]